MDRKATAVYQSTGQTGDEKVTVETGTFAGSPYNFQKHFGESKGLNPEELTAVAHAGCFSRSLLNELQELGVEVDSFSVTSNVELEKDSSEVNLLVGVEAADADPGEVKQAAETALAGCTLSQLFGADLSVKLATESGDEKSWSHMASG